MTTKLITERIYIEPEFLNSNIKEKIFEKINTLADTCSQDYGYILKIFKNTIRIPNGIVSTTGPGVYFTVSFKAKTIKPEIGKKYIGEVYAVYSYGILVKVEKMKGIYIPADKIPGYSYNEKQYYEKKGYPNITKGVSVKFLIEIIKYENKAFKCLGTLIPEITNLEEDVDMIKDKNVVDRNNDPVKNPASGVPRRAHRVIPK